MKKSPVRLLYSVIFCCISMFHSSESLADEGEKFLSIRCNEKGDIFEVEPLIVWNKELDSLKTEIAKSNGNIKQDDKLLIQFSMNPPALQPSGSLEASCTISNTHLKMTVTGWDFPQMNLFTENKKVASIAIKNVWWFAGDVFRVRYTPEKSWEELCGDQDASSSWHPLDTKRQSTNCTKPRNKGK